MQPHFSPKTVHDDRATVFRPFSLASPHMLDFHLAWLNLFSCFFSTFSIPPLLPVIRYHLHLTPTDIGNAGIASFVGSIFYRLLMGPTCDLVGPRIASGTLSLITAPVILATAFVSTPQPFITIRFLVGFSLANFVSNQFWMTSMFSPSVVGLANGLATGWANVGSGVTQLVMPLVYSHHQLQRPVFHGLEACVCSSCNFPRNHRNTGLGFWAGPTFWEIRAYQDTED